MATRYVCLNGLANEKTGFSAVSGDIETIYNDGQDLFIGSQNALYICLIRRIYG